MSTDTSTIIETPAMIVTIDGLKASQVILLKRFYERLTGRLAEDLTEEVLAKYNTTKRLVPLVYGDYYSRQLAPPPLPERELPPVAASKAVVPPSAEVVISSGVAAKKLPTKMCVDCDFLIPPDGQHDCPEKKPHWLFKTLVQPIIDAAGVGKEGK